MDRQIAASATGVTSFVTSGKLPRLEAGDHLDQPTFHARYQAMPSSFRAELVEGKVIVPSPLSQPHAQTSGWILNWLGRYTLHTPGTTFLDNGTIILSPQDEPQPDAALPLDSACGGQARSQGEFVVGAPELIVEVASSSEADDLHDKFRAYLAANAREYLVVLLRDRRIEWYVNREGCFVLLPADHEGIVRSEFFLGLWLDSAAILARNGAQLLATLDRGLATPEHAKQAAQWQRVLELATQRRGSKDEPAQP